MEERSEGRQARERAEQAAVEHVRAIEAANGEGSHSLTSCPPFTRAMCSHRLVIRKMQDEGRWAEASKL